MKIYSNNEKRKKKILVDNNRARLYIKKMIAFTTQITNLVHIHSNFYCYKIFLYYTKEFFYIHINIHNDNDNNNNNSNKNLFFITFIFLPSSSMTLSLSLHNFCSHFLFFFL